MSKPKIGNKARLVINGRTIKPAPVDNYSLGPNEMSIELRDVLNIRVSVEVNDRRVSQEYVLPATSVEDLSKSELAKLVDDLARQCLRDCALKHYEHIFGELNGLQKLQRVAKDVKDE